MKTGTAISASDEARSEHELTFPARATPPSSAAQVSRASGIRREVPEDQICVLTFDRPDSSANVFDYAALAELDSQLAFIAGNAQLKGVIVASAKPSIFIAGADLHALANASSDELLRLVELGQAVFNRLASLSVPTVAAIHGACVGGGCELALACDYRVATPDRATKMGLPETQLGIVPAWGGSTRLPRLIGLPKALDVILGGKTLAAKQALRYGMVDDLVPRERLIDYARNKILTDGIGLRKRPGGLRRRVTNNALVANLISLRVESQLLKKTRGHYPALFKALEIVTKGVSRSREEALRLEREAILELAQTEESRNLVRVFFMQERAKKLNYLVGDAAERVKPVRGAAVMGAGIMGAGIAQWLSARGVPVILRDVHVEQLAKGMASVARLYEEGVKRRAFTRVAARAGMDRIFPSATDVPLSTADIVIEAAVEKMPLKKAIFARLSQLARPDTILATNTSALSVSELAATVKSPERVVGIHFFNPVHRMQLVEVVIGRETSPDVAQRAVRFVQQIGKLPVLVKDSPGFLVNRILMPYLIEAGHLFEAGASVEDIDGAMLDFGMPMGPLRLLDEVGVDVADHVAETLAGSFKDRFETPRVLSQMGKAGLFGRKSERGFYLYASKDPEPNAGLSLFQKGDAVRDLAAEELQKRMTLLMVNEAARCLEEEIVVGPADVDFAMIMGAGFAPFRGGPLRYADSRGVENVVSEMNRLAEGCGSRFQPCPLLQRMVADRKRFYYEGEGRS